MKKTTCSPLSPQVNKYNQVYRSAFFAAFSFELILTRGIKRCAFDYTPQGKHAKTYEG